ncbi:MAG: DUF5658 family protein [Candidatus Polarisedimenticolaceae bacterium]|nr:DUF5658 family protein [Candidatus Polarisedimenticolaceae bacterium]
MQQNRRIADRRTQDISPFSHHRLLGRRRASRRSSSGDTVAGLSDLYPKQFMAIAVSIMLLSLMDAINTLHLLQKGARETNLVMDLLIQQDPQLFIACKLMLTGLGMIMLMAYHNARIGIGIGIGIRVRFILYGTLLGYAALILYQWSMFRSLA